MAQFRPTDNLMLAMQPTNIVEAKVFSLWKDLDPAGAYLNGVDECVARVFEADEEFVNQLLGKIRRLRNKSDDQVVLKILDSFEISLIYREPFVTPRYIVDALFGYMVKEGIKPEHIRPLLESSLRALRISRRSLSADTWSTPLKILTQIACGALREVLAAVSSGTKDVGVKQKVNSVLNEVNEYATGFRVEGFKEGRYEDVMKILSKGDSTMGRADVYEKFIRMAFDYTETSEELIRKGETWIREELRKLRLITEKLAKIHRCEATVQAVTSAIAKKDSLKGRKLIKSTMKMRKILQPYVHKFVVRINPDYETSVIETPPYLTRLLPSAAAFGINQLTDKPEQLYLITTDEKLSPMSSFAEVINTWIHEEMGHTLHFSNTAKAYAAKPTLLEKILTTHSGPISEGLAFQREMEFLEAVKEAVGKRRNSPEEKKLLEYLEENGGLERRLLELEFVTRKWRLLRFLRVVGDARTNSHAQTLPEFLDWAEKTTGIDKKTVYYQLFPAHQTNGPGYATTYAVIGQEIARVERKLKGDRRKLVRLTTVGCSMGYPPRTIYIQRLKKFAASMVSSSKPRRT